jgi:hypothetical protein
MRFEAASGGRVELAIEMRRQQLDVGLVVSTEKA